MSPGWGMPGVRPWLLARHLCRMMMAGQRVPVAWPVHTCKSARNGPDPAPLPPSIESPGATQECYPACSIRGGAGTAAGPSRRGIVIGHAQHPIRLPTPSDAPKAVDFARRHRSIGSSIRGRRYEFDFVTTAGELRPALAASDRVVQHLGHAYLPENRRIGDTELLRDVDALGAGVGAYACHVVRR